MFEDVRYALRSLGRSKALTAVLLVSLALGTGANAAVCGVVYALLLQPPAGIVDPGGLLSVFTSEFGGSPYGRSSYADFHSLAEARLSTALAAYDDDALLNVRLGAPTRTARVAAVTENFFDVLRMEASSGRLLQAGDNARSPAPVVVSAALADFLGDRGTMVGQRIDVGEQPYEVIGVAPADFRGLRGNRPTDAWIPVRAEGREDRGDRRLSIIARHEGNRRGLQRELDAISVRLADEHPATNRGSLVDETAPRRFSAIDYSPRDPAAGSGFVVVASVVVGAVLLLLLSACVNAGTLLLSRAMARRHEFAVKRALGATRSRLVRQLVAESVFVSLAGGALGLLFAIWIIQALPALFSPDQAELLQTSRIAPLMLLTLGVAAIAGVLFGVAPAFRGTDAPESLVLRGDSGAISGGSRGTRTRSLLLAAQLALSTLLLVVTAMLVRSLDTALEGEFGVDAASVAMISMEYRQRCVGDSESRNDALRKIPGVDTIGWAAMPPLARGTLRPYSVEAGLRTYDRADLAVNLISPSYFEAMNVPLIAGRLFTSADRTRSEPVAIVDDLLAQRYFGASAVGKHLIDNARGERIRVVGVVRSGRYRTLQDAPQPTLYRPLLQEYLSCGFIFARTEGDAAALLPVLVRTIERSELPGTVVTGKTMNQHLSDALVVDRIATTMVGICGLIALVMGAMGVYGAMSDAVLRRTREIGLRVALGAGRTQVVRLILAEALFITAVGVTAGLATAVAAEYLVANVVHGLLRSDLSMLARTPVLLAAAVALAAVMPLRRALSVNPAKALGLQT
jgi:predicted permease